METNTDVRAIFAEDVFTDEVMRARLSEDVYRQLRQTVDDGCELTYSLAGAIAEAMMQWAIERGATHYTHWFQPMTGLTAEKRNSFFESAGLNEKPLLSFSARELIRGEADGSSFPSGGLRATFEARGYTTWDCTSPAFLKRDQNGACCLCVPTAFCAFSGEALDEKTPLLRSMEALNTQALRVLRHLGDSETKRVTPTVGAEQEYFLIDKRSFLKRMDLAYTGRTLFGATPAKGQELSDQYYAATPEKVLTFMHELNDALWRMGVPCKTEHNEVAPSQFELAPLFASANVAVDHNQIIMEMMHRIAERNDLTCLLHEKPFMNVNGSGKHNNWSLCTDTGHNLLKHGKDEKSAKIFFTFLMAAVAAVDEYAPMLRMSCATIGNEYRLGGHEAPPQIISVFLGSALQQELAGVASGAGISAHTHEMMRLGVSTIASLKKDDTDRNRTSPFAFTGNKFEFRMVGSSQSLGMPNTVLNTALADILMRIADALDKAKDTDMAWQTVMRGMYEKHGRVIFNGNNYEAAWLVEAKKRGLPNIDNTVDAINATANAQVRAAFEKHHVLDEGELKARREIALSNYATAGRIEGVTMLKMARQTIMPAVARYSAALADSVVRTQQAEIPAPAQLAMLREVNKQLNQVRLAADALEGALGKLDESESALETAVQMRDTVLPRMQALREAADRCERVTDKKFWPLPSYGEMLFGIV